MRKSTFENVLHAVTSEILEGYLKMIDHVHADLKHVNGRLTELNIKMNKLQQPAIEMTPELAEAITAKITAGNCYPAEYKAWLTEVPNSGIFRQQLLGTRYGAIQTQIHPDGKIHLALQDMNGQIFWQMVLEPKE